MRLVPLLVAGLTACSAGSSSSIAPSSPGSTASVSVSASPSAGASASTEPVSLPPGVPATYEGGQAAGDVPVASLVPAEAQVTGTWYAPQGTLTSIVVAYSIGDDPLFQEHGLVLWSEYADEPRWRAAYGFRDKAKDGVFGITAVIGDATGDGLEDALTFEATGGSGGCGTYRVISVVDAAEVFSQTVCDTFVDVASAPAGLTLTEAVFGPGDDHCCPSAQRVTRLRYTGSGWKVISRETLPLAP